MKTRIACLILALGCCTAGADELSDGIKAWERQDYAQAQRIFAKLAAAGNPEAQRQLGEMSGFGEGVPEDLAGARRWMERARAGGSKDAAASLALVERRAAGKADIGRILAYDGAGLALARYACVAPAIPAASASKEDIDAVHRRVADWYACYGRFAHALAAAPAGNAIPPATAEIMNTAELARARTRMDSVFARLAAEGKSEADAVVAAEAAWIGASERQLRGAGEMTAALVAMKRRGGDIIRGRSEEAGDLARGSLKR
jgi:hypothetical protein